MDPQQEQQQDPEKRIADLILACTYVDAEGCVQGEGDAARQIFIELGGMPKPPEADRGTAPLSPLTLAARLRPLLAAFGRHLPGPLFAAINANIDQAERGGELDAVALRSLGAATRRWLYMLACQQIEMQALLAQLRGDATTAEGPRYLRSLLDTPQAERLQACLEDPSLLDAAIVESNVLLEAIGQARALLSRLPHMRDEDGPCIPCVRCALDRVLSRAIDEPTPAVCSVCGKGAAEFRLWWKGKPVHQECFRRLDERGEPAPALATAATNSAEP